MNIATWIIQGLLALGFGMAGAMKLMTPYADLAKNPDMGWVNDVPEWMPMMIGLAEVVGAIGLIVPALTRIQPKLTVYAAYALALVMLLAIIMHFTRGEYMVVPQVVLLSLSLFVAWSRSQKVPITAKN